ncbi:hypothetical protein ABT390_37070 [Streptomyces aurantiacus]|uniref:Uncharacterized protein n=1 Tax=Streptomyces aurantiacus JA 4570 TaxID=1286094 RepID=S3ZR03_9ACTN|nr:hypothetical protein [Streptomyces aurantiacus]EPH45244.1 hypothetical protein STRAU_1720 [Streptomyces aurantiacus JA 4570]
MSAIRRVSALSVTVLAAAGLFTVPAQADSASANSATCGSRLEHYSGTFTGSFKPTGEAAQHVTVEFLDSNAVHATTVNSKTGKVQSVGGNYFVAEANKSPAIALNTMEGTFAGLPSCHSRGHVVKIKGGVSKDGFKTETPLTLKKV